MGIKNPRVDAYFAKSATFAQPILMHLRKLVHKHCPDVIETIKWGMPHTDYKGGIFCGMAVTGNSTASYSPDYDLGTMPSRSTTRRGKWANQHQRQSRRSEKRHGGIGWRGLRQAS